MICGGSTVTMSMAKSSLKMNGGKKLDCLCDSDKWEFPWGKTYSRRSWKHYRRTQYK